MLPHGHLDNLLWSICYLFLRQPLVPPHEVVGPIVGLSRHCCSSWFSVAMVHCLQTCHSHWDALLAPRLRTHMVPVLIFMYTPGSLAAGILAMICGLVQSSYCCLITYRIEYATRVLSVATANPPAKLNAILIPTMLYCILYACLLVSGILGITATKKPAYRIIVPVILTSLVWTMQVMRNVILVTISGIKYIRYTRKTVMQTLPELWDYLGNSMGYISIASAVVPVIEFILLSARMRLLARFNSEFLSSCANRYSSWATRMIMFGNWFGFVHLGVYCQAIKEASIYTLGQLRRTKMEGLILSDLTGSFCFLSAVTGGAICGLVGGIWTFAVEKSYATEITLYAFLIGYLMVNTCSIYIYKGPGK